MFFASPLKEKLTKDLEDVAVRKSEDCLKTHGVVNDVVHFSHQRIRNIFMCFNKIFSFDNT